MPEKTLLAESTSETMKLIKSHIVQSKDATHECKFCRDTGLLDLYFTKEYTEHVNETNSSTYTVCDCGVTPEIEVEGSVEYERMRSKLK